MRYCNGDERRIFLVKPSRRRTDSIDDRIAGNPRMDALGRFLRSSVRYNASISGAFCLMPPQVMDLLSRTTGENGIIGPWSRGILSIVGIESLFPMRRQRSNPASRDIESPLRSRIQVRIPRPRIARVAWRSDEA